MGRAGEAKETHYFVLHTPCLTRGTANASRVVRVHGIHTHAHVVYWPSFEFMAGRPSERNAFKTSGTSTKRDRVRRHIIIVVVRLREGSREGGPGNELSKQTRARAFQ